MAKRRVAIGVVMALGAAGFAGPALAGACTVASYGTMPVEIVGERATTIARVNDRDERFMLDTGASRGTMSRASAEAMGLKLQAAPYGLRGSGIGGSYDLELTYVKKLGILGATVPDVEFTVGGSDVGRAIIGANLLDVADLDIDLAHGKLRLLKPSGCDKLAMAYWSNGGAYQVADLHPAANPYDRRSFVTVTINGKPFRALLDTGAQATLLSRRAAEKAGIDLASPGVRASYATGGFGAKRYQSWTVPIDSFSVGTETIQHSRMQVLDGDIATGADAPDMLLAIDFFLAHHLYIANSQRKLYFTYNGGRVFTLAGAKTGAAAPAEAAAESAPASAEDYALRGQARLARGDRAGALADLDEAVRLAPGKAGTLAARARVQLALGHGELALGDATRAVELDPGDVETRLLRARLRLRHRDRPGAAEDIAAARKLAPAGTQQARAIAAFYMNTDQPAQALPILDDWIRLHGDDAGLASALAERCRARALANQALEGALADCRKAIRREGERPGMLDSLALVELRQGHFADAIGTFRKALAAAPRQALARYALGRAEVQAGQAEAGQADIAAARTIEPGIEARAQAMGL